MSEARENQRGGGAGCAVACVLMAMFLLVAYVLGVGPASWIGENFPETQGFLSIVYLPLALLVENCEPIGVPLKWYVELWV